MKILITGVAGFIGSALGNELLSQGHDVIGIDNVNDYYDVDLKKARLARLEKHKNFSFYKLNIADRETLFSYKDDFQEITHLVNLAAQAGVRYSLLNPYAYVETNVMGFVNMLELARQLPLLKHFVYASSSSVYGANKDIPFSVDDPVNKPISLYAATKRSNELIAYTYAHLYGLSCTGLRFFTVYGPWGRPDMAAYLFAKKITEGTPIPVFNKGNMRRDFTYIDDIVMGILAALTKVSKTTTKETPSRVYNLGRSKTENLMDYIGEIEKALGQKAIYDFLPMQDGDVQETFADIEKTQRDLGYAPTTSIEEGIPRFIAWYKRYHHLS